MCECIAEIAGALFFARAGVEVTKAETNGSGSGTDFGS
jgi:hypothetical protein